MKIFNKQKTHFLKKTNCGLYQIKYDTIENVTFVINNILDNGHKKLQSQQTFQPFKKELI